MKVNKMSNKISNMKVNKMSNKSYDAILLSRKDGYCDFFPGDHYPVTEIYAEFANDCDEQSFFHLPYQNSIFVGSSIIAAGDTCYEDRRHENTVIYQINDSDMIHKLGDINLETSFPREIMMSIKQLESKVKLKQMQPCTIDPQKVKVNDNLKKKIAALLYQIKKKEGILYPADDTTLFLAIGQMLPGTLVNNLAIYCNGHFTNQAIDWQYDVVVYIGCSKNCKAATCSPSMIDEKLLNLVDTYNALSLKQKSVFDDILQEKAEKGGFGTIFSRDNLANVLDLFETELAAYLKAEQKAREEELAEAKRLQEAARAAETKKQRESVETADGKKQQEAVATAAEKQLNQTGDASEANSAFHDQACKAESYEEVIDDLTHANLIAYTMEYLRCEHDHSNTLCTMYRKLYKQNMDGYTDFVCILKDHIIDWPEIATDRLMYLCQEGLFEYVYLYPNMTVTKQTFKEFLIQQFLEDVNKNNSHTRKLLMEVKDSGSKGGKGRRKSRLF